MAFIAFFLSSWLGQITAGGVAGAVPKAIVGALKNRAAA
jgi:hypothetical protein